MTSERDSWRLREFGGRLQTNRPCRSSLAGTATAMTFYVKSESADGSLNLILCFEPRQVFDSPGINAKAYREGN
jgi:hypothetical protein